jgi:DNA helicase-2/ATP-dependent DNA helicase PcrA
VFARIEETIRSANLPYHKKLSASAYESESQVMRQLELALRILGNPSDRLHLKQLMVELGFKGVPSDLTNSELSANSIKPALDSLIRKSKGPFAKTLGKALDALNWSPGNFEFDKALEVLEEHAEKMEDEERLFVVQDAQEWKKHWDYFLRSQTGGDHDVSTFLSQVALGTTQQPRREGVALLTVHSAKGLEFDIVFVVGLCEGVFPDYRATTGPKMEEEKRSMFVAVTRSKRLLYLTYPKLRMMPWGDVKAQQPSRFIRGIGLSGNRRN